MPETALQPEPRRTALAALRLPVRYVPVAFAVAAGLVLTAAAYRAVDRLEHRKLEVEFARRANDRIAAIGRSVDDDIRVLAAVSSLFDASERVEPHEFRAFVEPLLSDRSSIRAIEWVPRVPEAERGEFEAAARASDARSCPITELGESNTMVPAAPRSDHFPVLYLEPLLGDDRTIGFDVASCPVRREALERARDTGQPAATARVALLQPGDEHGVFIVKPRYRKGAPIATLEQRRENLEGFVVGVFRIGDLLEMAMCHLEPCGIDIELADVTDPGRVEILGRDECPTGDDRSASQAASSSPATRRSTLPVAGRQWRATATAAPQFYMQRASMLPLWVGGCGALVTLLLGAYLLQLLGRTVRIERLVTARTAELTRQTEALDREIAERRAAESALETINRELAGSNAELAERNREVLQLAYAITHDLQTPLATLTGAVDALACRLDHEAGGPTVKWMTRIKSSSRRMVRMLDDLMVYAKAGTESLRQEPVHLAGVIDLILEELGSSARAKDVRVSVDCDASTVMADAEILIRVLSNLVGNAIKYVEPGPDSRIEITVARDGAVVRVAIKDNGPGIDPFQLEEVFRPFKRARAEETPGTGLGLSIVRKYVASFGGRVWLESDGRSGTTAVVELPAAGARLLPARVKGVAA